MQSNSRPLRSIEMARARPNDVGRNLKNGFEQDGRRDDAQRNRQGATP
jgi:hypothetical protein